MSAPGAVPRYVDFATILLSAASNPNSVRMFSGYCTAWNGTTRENTVSGGAQEFTDLPSMFPTLMAVGPVVLVQVSDAAPFILGRIYLPDPGA